jgi:hypothetical protein
MLHDAAVPSAWEVLIPALRGIGGVVFLALLSTFVGVVSYFLLSGEAAMPSRDTVALRRKRDVPVGTDQLGAIE